MRVTLPILAENTNAFNTTGIIVNNTSLEEIEAKFNKLNLTPNSLQEYKNSIKSLDEIEKGIEGNSKEENSFNEDDILKDKEVILNLDSCDMLQIAQLITPFLVYKGGVVVYKKWVDTTRTLDVSNLTLRERVTVTRHRLVLWRKYNRIALPVLASYYLLLNLNLDVLNKSSYTMALPFFSLGHKKFNKFILLLIPVFILFIKLLVLPLLDNPSLFWFLKEKYFVHSILFLILLWNIILAIYNSLEYLFFSLYVKNPNLVLPWYLNKNKRIKEIKTEALSTFNKEFKLSIYRSLLIQFSIFFAYSIGLIYYFF